MFCLFRRLVVHSTDTGHEYGTREHDLQLKLPPKRKQKRNLDIFLKKKACLVLVAESRG